MEKIELLAPAGSLESLYAAVNSGCDAVYLGGSKFSARAYASNFGEEEMKEAVLYCHLNSVKIYVTINTLIKDKEMKEAIEYVNFLQSIGVDGVIVQDLGLAYLIRKNFKDIELHGSTQISIHNGEGAKLLNDLGFKRIVLARECTLKEIEHISKDLGIETEIFVHGALCVSYSGQCLMSSMIGGRSGNRGKCAQSCRQNYKLINERNGEETEGYLLSPKDLAFIENIGEIIESGTASLKIEGRMKKPEYVAGVVSIYRKAIDAYYAGESFDYDNAMKNLAKLFNREGFSKGYLFKNVGADMMSFKFPRNTGIVIGEAVSSNEVLLKENIVVGDGIRFGEEGFTISSITVKGKNVEEAYMGDVAKLKEGKFKKGEKIYKTADVKLLKSYESTFKTKYLKRNPLDLNVYFKIGEKMKITTSFRGKTFEVYGEEVQTPLKRPLFKENIEENLKKTGNTPFEVSNIIFSEYEEGFMAISALNNLRRTLIEDIIDWVKVDRALVEKLDLNRETKNIKELPSVLVIVQNLKQLKGAYKGGARDIAINPFMRGTNIDFSEIPENLNLYLRMPTIIKEEYKMVSAYIEQNLDKIKGLITSNFGITSEFHNRTSIIFDYKGNLFNKYSIDFLESMVDGVTLSVELNKNELKDVSKGTPLTPYVYIYGKVESMISEYCPIGATFGGKCEVKGCNIACEKGDFILRDRLKEDFRVKTDKFCRSHIYNSHPINLVDNIKELKGINISNFRLDFVDEDENRVQHIVEAILSGNNIEGEEKFTKGQYKRGVQ